MVQKRSAAQTHLVHMGDYDVTITRKRVRNVNLRVRRDGSVCVSVPWRMPLAEAERFVRERRTWIETHRQRVSAAERPPLAWTDGDVVTLWGVPLTLRVVADEGVGMRAGHATQADTTLELHMAPGLAEGDGVAAERRGAVVDAFLAAELRARLTALLPACEARVGRRASAIRLRRMVSRWGSCNVETARITLNLELAERPPACLEAVLCHELCHLHERGHNQRFYARLDQACPTWREAHALLGQTPPRR